MFNIMFVVNQRLSQVNLVREYKIFKLMLPPVNACDEVRPLAQLLIDNLVSLDHIQLRDWINQHPAFNYKVNLQLTKRYHANESDIRMALYNIEARLRGLMTGDIEQAQLINLCSSLPQILNSGLNEREHMIVALTTHISGSYWLGTYVLFAVSSRSFETIRKLAEKYSH